MARIDANKLIARYNDAKTTRNRHENDWRMASAYCLPRHYNAWQTEGPANFGGSSTAATRRIAYDSTGVLALPKYVAILERIATPHSMRWHGLAASNKDLMKLGRVRGFFDELQDLVFKMRYAPRANFRQSITEVYGSLGVYGTGPNYLGQRTPNSLSKAQSFLYKACPLRDIFILLNDEGEVDTVFRRFWLNVRQFQQKFPDIALPPCMAVKIKNGATASDMDFFEFVHAVHPRTDHDPEAIDMRRHPIVGSYACVADQAYIGGEQGYRSMPYQVPRTFTEAGDPYGFSPAMQALPALGTASAVKKTTLRQGQKAADPVLLTHDDGVLNGSLDLRPGAANPGGVSKEGKKLIQTLDSGNFQISDKLLEDERRDINDSFFVTLFQILMETPEMTATEVVERSAEKSALLSPTMGRIQSEQLGPQIEREIDLLQEMGLLADGPNSPGLQMPPELIEAKGDFEIIYTSPMSKAMYAEEVSGFMRTVETSLNVAQAAQDPSHLDHFDFDTAIPEIAYYQAVPQRWMNDDKKKKAIADKRAQQQQQSELLKNSANIAGAMKSAKDMQEGTPK